VDLLCRDHSHISVSMQSHLAHSGCWWAWDSNCNCQGELGAWACDDWQNDCAYSSAAKYNSNAASTYADCSQLTTCSCCLRIFSSAARCKCYPFPKFQLICTGNLQTTQQFIPCCHFFYSYLTFKEESKLKVLET
jgi:hypothetical protein